jgi:hypothetical protein
MSAVFDKYFSQKLTGDGSIISTLIMDICTELHPTNILFLRSTTTGRWLDKITLPDLYSSINLKRIKYQSKKLRNMRLNNQHHPSTIVVDEDNLSQYLQNLQIQFDLIVIDPFHDKESSYRDLVMTSEILTSNGILLSHDCAPTSAKIAVPDFIDGAWSGLTFAAIVYFASQHPYWYWRVLDLDTGIGIMSKNPTKYTEHINSPDSITKQQIFNQLIADRKFTEAHSYFQLHAPDLIGLIRKPNPTY